MQMLRLILLSVVFSFLFAGAFNPDVKWYQYETKNFRLFFNDNSRYLADETYEIIEEIYDRISAELGYKVREKVDIIFNDSSDIVLDYANYFSNTIMLTTAKIHSSQIGPFSKGPLYNLLTHELTHIVHLQMSPVTDGIYTFVKRTTAKGMLYPYFMIEGAAIFNEKQIANGGRLYNTSYLEQFMAFAKEDDFPTLTQTYQRSMVRWPMGSAPYLFGARFVDYLVDTYGLGRLVESYRYFAGQVNESYEQAFLHIYGISLADEHAKFISTYKNLYLIKKNEDQKYKAILGGDVEVGCSLFTKDGYYAYLNDFKQSPRIIYVAGEETITIFESSLLLDTKIATSRGELYFTRALFPNIYESRFVLVRLDNNREVVIDDGVVDIAINDNRMLYIKSNLGKDSIVSLENNIKEVIYNEGSLEAIAVSVSGEKYAFIEKIKNQKTVVLSSDNSRKEIVSGDIKDVVFVGEDVWFVAGINGLGQLFRYDSKTGNIYQKTKVLTGVYNPQVVGDTIYFVTYTSRGMSLVSLKNSLDEPVNRKGLLVSFAPSVEYKWVSGDKKEEKPTTNINKAYSSSWMLEKNKEPIKSATDYSIWSLKMMYLYPYFYVDNYGSAVAVSTYLSDSLEFNVLALNFYGATYGKFFNIQYLNSSFYPNYTLQTVKDGINDYFMTGFVFPVRNDTLQQSLFLGLRDHYDNDVLTSNSYSLQYMAGNINMFPYSISYEKGFINQMNIDVSRTSSRVSVLDSLKLYLPGFDKNHVINLSLLGAYSKEFSYKISGIPGITYVRGLDLNDKICGGILGKVSCEYRLPIVVVDELSLFGLYHRHTGLILFSDIADAKDSNEQFMKNPFWSYGVSVEMLGEYSNFYPISVGLGIAKTSQKESVIFFSLGSLLN